MRRSHGALVLLAVGSVALTIVALGGPDVEAGGHAGGHRPAVSGPAVLDLRPRWGDVGRPVSGRLIGLSIEWPTLARDLGGSERPRPALVAALRALGRPSLRIGGNSQDRMWPAAAPRPIGATWSPPGGFWSRLGRLAASAAGPVQVGLDLAHADAPADRAIVHAARRVLPRGGVVFALGNEPDRYGLQPWARGAGGRRITPRPRGWSFADYLRGYRRMRSRLGDIGPLVGPDFADGRWRRDLGAFLRTVRPREATLHAYPLAVCGHHRRSRLWPTAGRLLAPSAWAGKVARGLAWASVDARRAHVPLVISEANSVACRGARGVSDGPAAALWAPAFLLSAARAGIAQVDFHASGAPYDPFGVRGGPGGRGALRFGALFDGLVFTHRALVPGARLVPMSSRPRVTAAWALRTPGGGARVVVEDLAPRRALVVRVGMPTPDGVVRIIRMVRAGRDPSGSARMAIGGGVVMSDRPAPSAPPVAFRRAAVRITLPPLSAAIVVASAGGGPVRSHPRAHRPPRRRTLLASARDAARHDRGDLRGRRRAARRAAQRAGA